MLSDFRRSRFLTFFRHMDLDGDGVITGEDFSRYAETIRAERGWDADAPRLAELRAATDEWWASLREMADSNDNDEVCEDEFLRFFEGMGAALAAGGSPPVWAMQVCAGIHGILDLTGSGTVTAEEYAAWLRAIRSQADPQEAFSRIDARGEGEVTLPELMVLFAQFILSEDPAEPGNYVMTGAL